MIRPVNDIEPAGPVWPVIPLRSLGSAATAQGKGSRMSFSLASSQVSLMYSGGPLDRASYRRADPDWIAGLLGDASAARLVPVWRDHCLVSGDPPLPVMSADPSRQATLRGLSPPVFLGLDGTAGVFAVDLSSLPQERALRAAGAERMLDVRRLVGRVPPARLDRPSSAAVLAGRTVVKMSRLRPRVRKGGNVIEGAETAPEGAP
jgi:NADH pyrophosphatase-like rudimentary NUDIX domain